MQRMLRILSMLTVLVLFPVFAAGETVVTSFYPIWLLALNLADGVPGLEVRNLAAPDTGCLHDYQLQTGDMKTLAEADLFLVNGAGMESYLDLVYSAFPGLPVIRATDGIPLLSGTEALQIGEEENADTEVNAHVWLSASNAARMAANLAGPMMEHCPEHQARIQQNLEALTARLEKLDTELKEGLTGLPRRGIITFHEAFPYFASAYGLEVLAVVNREPGETLTPSQMAALADAILDLGTPPLFVEPQYEDLSARTLAAETGAKIYVLDPVVTGPEKDVPLDYYDTVMRTNMETLRTALSE
ncbi:MAG: metal ABC transporter substrate-binding protein [Clostridiales bacterium]|nr:metal ABC transporter substrate-binding protein [Clostridiales bacterium]